MSWAKVYAIVSSQSFFPIVFNIPPVSRCMVITRGIILTLFENGRRRTTDQPTGHILNRRVLFLLGGGECGGGGPKGTANHPPSLALVNFFSQGVETEGGNPRAFESSSALHQSRGFLKAEGTHTPEAPAGCRVGGVQASQPAWSQPPPPHQSPSATY